MNPYGVNASSVETTECLIRLTVLYSSLPETTGCEKCEEVNGTADKHWCCRVNNPSMYYAEFLKVWKHVIDTFTKEQKQNLVLRAIKNYLSNDLNKGCIFYDNACTIYEHRPLVCMNYGVIPQKDWDARYEKLKKEYGDEFNARPQCNLVSTKSGKPVKSEQQERWFQISREIERSLGVPKDAINRHDAPGGSYRTFHDHLLVEMFDLKFMHFLTQLRLTNPSAEDIDKTISVLRDQLSTSSHILCE